MFKVGDFVYVPNAYHNTWKPWLTSIKEIINGKYICEVKHRDQSVADVEFDAVFGDPLSCNDYINNYYYDGLCKGCAYEKDGGNILRCSGCEHLVEVSNDTPMDCINGYCAYTNIRVWSQRNPSGGMEICKNYSPLPQYRGWSWERYEDILKNCDFNQHCKHHKESCHKTCSYEMYLNEFVKIPVKLIHDGRKVNFGLIKRREWIDQSFKAKDGFLLWGVCFATEYNINGEIMKANQVEMFEQRKLF